MSIQATFSLANERITIRIIGDNVLFIDTQNNILAPLEGLKISKQGVIKEHPDLKDNPNWKQIAIQRFSDKIKSFSTEKEKMEWMIQEMSSMGYIPLYSEQPGFRPKRIK